MLTTYKWTQGVGLTEAGDKLEPGMWIDLSEPTQAEMDKVQTAFDLGILSLNISVMDRGEMEDAMIHPELHQNLFVRVGGFSARFVNLDPGTQADMLSRAMY